MITSSYTTSNLPSSSFNNDVKRTIDGVTEVKSPHSDDHSSSTSSTAYSAKEEPTRASTAMSEWGNPLTKSEKYETSIFAEFEETSTSTKKSKTQVVNVVGAKLYPLPEKEVTFKNIKDEHNKAVINKIKLIQPDTNQKQSKPDTTPHKRYLYEGDQTWNTVPYVPTNNGVKNVSTKSEELFTVASKNGNVAVYQKKRPVRAVRQPRISRKKEERPPSKPVDQKPRFQRIKDTPLTEEQQAIQDAYCKIKSTLDTVTPVVRSKRTDANNMYAALDKNANQWYIAEKKTVNRD